MKLVSIRLDDIVPGMNWERFLSVKKILDENHIKPLIGIVPDCLDEKLNIEVPREDFWMLMKELRKEGWTIAQHGYQHLYKTNDSGLLKVNNISEFAGLPLDEQVDKIARGKSILERNEIFTEIFMAPAHSFDKNTLLALKKAGFKIITDGYTSKPYEFYGLKFIPCMHSMPPIFNRGVLTICLHTNTITDYRIKKIASYIVKNREQIVDYSELINISSDNKAWKLEQRFNIIKMHFVKKIYRIYCKLRKFMLMHQQ